MRTYTQSELDELIGCPKVVVQPPKREMKLERGSRRNDMEVESREGKRKFSVFMRVNEALPENFSIGLMYHPADDPASVPLLRCNGQHGPHANRVGDMATVNGFHVHKATEEAMVEEMEAWHHAAVTKEYASYQQGLAHFLRIANIKDAERYFPEIGQAVLFTADEEDK